MSPGLSGVIEAARTPVALLPRLGPACTVRDGRFVEPCAGVADMIGIELVQTIDKRTRQPSRATLAAVTVLGLAPIRCCPACGVEVPR